MATSTSKSRINDVQMWMSFRRQKLEEMSREDLLTLIEEMKRELVAQVDVTCGPTTAARFFNKKRSWIYEATSRPHTELQRCLSKIAAREPGGLLFRLSDLIRLRRRLFDKGGLS